MCKLGLFTKDQVAGRFGLTVATVDLYVEKAILVPFRIDGETYFTSSAFLHIEIIHRGKSFGFTLDEIKLLIDSAKSQNRDQSG